MNSIQIGIIITVCIIIGLAYTFQIKSSKSKEDYIVPCDYDCPHAKVNRKCPYLRECPWRKYV